MPPKDKNNKPKRSTRQRSRSNTNNAATTRRRHSLTKHSIKKQDTPIENNANIDISENNESSNANKIQENKAKLHEKSELNFLYNNQDVIENEEKEDEIVVEETPELTNEYLDFISDSLAGDKKTEVTSDDQVKSLDTDDDNKTILPATIKLEDEIPQNEEKIPELNKIVLDELDIDEVNNQENADKSIDNKTESIEDTKAPKRNKKDMQPTGRRFDEKKIKKTTQLQKTDYAIAKKDNTNKRIVKRRMDSYTRLNLIRLALVAIVGVGVIVGMYYFIQSLTEKNSGFASVEETLMPIVKNTQVPRERKKDENVNSTFETPNPAAIRDISFGSKDIEFKERQINQPGIFDTELLFSAGTGSLDGEVLTKLYLYNLDTLEEELVAESAIDYKGELYETYVNHNWLVWLDTDKGINNKITVMNRGSGDKFVLRNCGNGQPKLRLYGDILVWMEQVSDTEDELYMVDLNVQEDLTLSAFSTDKATYGVSAPCIYGDTIVWAGPDETQSEAQKNAKEHSGIYYQRLITDEEGMFSKPEVYYPGTYVHEPLYNGEVFVWLDTNKSRDGRLHLGRPGEASIIIDQGVTTYSIGEGVVVYGKNQAVWAYVIATGELCRLTSPDEMGMLPAVSKRTVVWYNLSSDSDKDVLRYKILTNDELYPGGMP